MQTGPAHDELKAKARSLRTAVVAGSGVAFLIALGLVATNPVGSQAAPASPDTGAGDPAADQPAGNPGPALSNPNPVTNVPQPQYQQPVLRSRRS